MPENLPDETGSADIPEEAREIIIKNLLGLVVPVEAVKYQRDFQGAIQTTTTSFGESISRLGEMQGKFWSTDNFDDRVLDTRALVLKAPELALVAQEDLLEESRKRLGLDSERDRLENALINIVSLEEGLKMFNTQTLARYGKGYKNAEDLAGDFPFLTAAEIAMLPLLVRVPQTYLDFGNQLSSRLDDELIDAKDLVPSYVNATVKGINFALSTYEYSSQERAIQTDPYSYLGMTEASQDFESVPYKQSVKEIIDRLLPLRYTNDRLHRSMWDDCGDAALGIGFGRISERAYEQVFGEKVVRDKKTQSIRPALRNMPDEKKREFEKRRSEIEETVFSSTLYDLGRDQIISPGDVFKMVGILEKVPESFVGSEPFAGFVKPYGPGIKILDNNGKFVEYVTYDPHFMRIAFHNIYWETASMNTVNNTTFRKLFGELQGQAEAKSIFESIEKNEGLTPLEGIKADLALQRDINLKIIPSVNVVELRRGDIFNKGVTRSGFFDQTNSKFTLGEAEDVREAVMLLPAAMCENVHTISKQIRSSQSLKDYLSGMTEQAHFSAGEIVLAETGEPIPFDLRESHSTRRKFIVIHEIGHSLWSELSEEKKKNWSEISWGEQASGRDEEKFLTFYSKQPESAEEDFCEHLAAYVMHAQEFRDKANDAEPLQKKYIFLRNFFKKMCGEDKEYSQISNVSLEAIHGALEQQVHKMSLEEAVDAVFKREQDEFNERKKEIGKVVKSIEKIKEEEDEENEEDEDEPGVRYNEDGDIVVESEASVLADQTSEADIIKGDVAEILGEYLEEEISDRLSARVSEMITDSNWKAVRGVLLANMDREEARDVYANLREFSNDRSDKVKA
jgi:hypothetical protein